MQGTERQGKLSVKLGTMMRLSVGIENVEDLIVDIGQAL